MTVIASISMNHAGNTGATMPIRALVGSSRALNGFLALFVRLSCDGFHEPKLSLFAAWQ
jgi:hypothetical protein